MDNAAFLVNFLGVEGQAVGPVVENEQTGILHAGTSCRHGRDIVHCLVNRGVGIQILSKFYAYGFAPVNDAVAGEVVGAVKAHVLQKVSQTALRVVFENRTDFLGNEEVGLALRRFVVADVVSQSVIKLAITDSGVDRKRRHLRHLRIDREGHAYQCYHGHQTAKKHFFHLVRIIMIVNLFENVEQVTDFTSDVES